MNTATHYSLCLNGERIGFLQGFEEHLSREITPQRAYRRNTPIRLHCGAEECILKLKRLRGELSNLLTPEALHNFTITLESADRRIDYEGCEFASISLKADGMGIQLEEATVYAQMRTVTSI